MQCTPTAGIIFPEKFRSKAIGLLNLEGFCQGDDGCPIVGAADAETGKDPENMF